MLKRLFLIEMSGRGGKGENRKREQFNAKYCTRTETLSYGYFFAINEILLAYFPTRMNILQNVIAF